MSTQYQVLARKYRPKNFHELLGQTHVAQALANAIDTGRLHHAYLFTGTRGVGKTTIARILAKCLNCQTGITSNPCGSCDVCVGIEQGRFLDLIEIDAASRTKVEDTRDLLENVPYAPAQGRYKVYLIDEVHMLSTHSFNALLKTLEEPPAHVKFIFATTDPQKLPITIVSRCLQFVLRPLSQQLLVEHLAKVLGSEGIDFANEALWQLASAAKGSVRDALSLTDQAIAFGGGMLRSDTVNQMLGLINQVSIVQLLELIYADDRRGVAEQIQQMREKMIDAAAVFDELIDSIHQMAVLQVLPEAPMDTSPEQAAKLQQLSAIIGADTLQLYYEIAIKSREGIRLANTPMQALEMAILRLLAFRPLTQAQFVHDDLARAELTDDSDQNDKITASATSASPSTNETIGSEACDDTDSVDTLDLQCNDAQSALQLDEQSINDNQADDGDDYQPNHQLVSYHDEKSPDNAWQANQDEPPRMDYPVPNPALLDDEMMVVSADFVVHDDFADDSTAFQNDTTPPNPAIKDDETTTHDELEQIDAEPTLAVLVDNEHEQPKEDFVEKIDDAQKLDANTLAQLDEATHSKDTPSDNKAQSSTGMVMSQAQMLDKLKPPSVELMGEWTVQKWDYWLHLARTEEIFAADELALMANSIMTGQVQGASCLHTSGDNSQVQASFASMLEKFAKHYPQIQLADKPVLEEMLAQTPQTLLQSRQLQIREDAQKQLIDSPVFLHLWQQGFVVNDGTAVLTNSKLSIET